MGLRPSMEKAVAAGEDAASFGEPTSQIWLSRTTLELSRLRELVMLLDDVRVQEGAVIRLNAAAAYAVDNDAIHQLPGP